MSQFKHALAARDSHIMTLKAAIAGLCLICIALWYGWQSAPERLTIYNPPDLRTGSTRVWWDVPPSAIYSFGFYIFQQMNRWPTDGQTDYNRNIIALSPYFTPSCKAYLEEDFKLRHALGELKERVRGVYEIPGRTFQNSRVTIIDKDNWVITLDLVVDEYYRAEPVKRALVRYPLKITRMDIDPENNPWGLAIDCFDSQPQKIEQKGVTPS